MDRILLATGITAGVLAQVPSASWQEMSALTILGVVLIWIVTRTQPAMQKQVVDLTTTFATTVEKIQVENVAIATKFTDLTAATLEKLDDWHERTIAAEVDLTKAITENRVALIGLQQHCAQRLAETKG
jgi:hypothetical protein